MKAYTIPTAFKIPHSFRRRFQLRGKNGRIICEIETKDGTLRLLNAQRIVGPQEHSFGLDWIAECVSRIREECQ